MPVVSSVTTSFILGIKPGQVTKALSTTSKDAAHKSKAAVSKESDAEETAVGDHQND